MCSSPGVCTDGVNGRLPNLDVVHGAAHIAKWVGGVPVRLHNQTHMEALAEESFANDLERYQQRAKGVLQQVAYSATTLPSGAEGLFALSVQLFAILYAQN
jgi:glycosylphosphatidylinositol transamidase